MPFCWLYNMELCGPAQTSNFTGEDVTGTTHRHIPHPQMLEMPLRRVAYVGHNAVLIRRKLIL